MVESSKLEYPGLLEDFCFTLYVKCLEIALFLLKKKKKKKRLEKLVIFSIKV